MIIDLIIGFIVGFIVGMLVGRKNPAEANKLAELASKAKDEIT